MAQTVTGQDRILVEKDGEEIEVWNHCSLQTRHYINSVNGHETFDPIITAGDSPDELDTYVTSRLASYLWNEWMIEVERLGIEVVNLSDDDVELI